MYTEARMHASWTLCGALHATWTLCRALHATWTLCGALHATWTLCGALWCAHLWRGRTSVYWRDRVSGGVGMHIVPGSGEESLRPVGLHVSTICLRAGSNGVAARLISAYR